jgi:pyruvate,orthophosphate dikinase
MEREQKAARSASDKLVYFFGAEKADGNAGMKDLLGGKGANLAEMTGMGIPVPPGFTISTRACNLYFERGRSLPAGLDRQVDEALARLETLQGKRFGDPRDPLLVSVRSGAKFSMPGMMDTILNLGLNDQAVDGLAGAGGDARFAWDSYRRFIQMYAGVVLDMDKHVFEEMLAEARKKRGVKHDTGLTASDLEKLTARYQAKVKQATRRPFPQDPRQQLWGAIAAVFRSWDNDRARLYRRQYGIPDDLGTAVNVQCMVFGNLGDDCATGVAFTRNPATGENVLYGEYLVNAQGEDVVAGIRTPMPISTRQAKGSGHTSLEDAMPEAHAEPRPSAEPRDPLATCRTWSHDRAAEAPHAADTHRCARARRPEHRLDSGGRCPGRAGVERVEPDMLVQLLAPIFAPKDLEAARRGGKVVAKGLPAGPGAASGVIAFTAKRAVEMAAKGKQVLLVRAETSPEDLAGMVAAVGIVTARGGMTSHAAVVARGMGKPCIVGAEALVIDEKGARLRVGKTTLREGDALAMYGTTGEVLLGHLDPHPSEIQQVLVEKTLDAKRSPLFARFARLMELADAQRTLKVRNSDTPHDARVARASAPRDRPAAPSTCSSPRTASPPCGR